MPLRSASTAGACAGSLPRGADVVVPDVCGHALIATAAKRAPSPRVAPLVQVAAIDARLYTSRMFRDCSDRRRELRPSRRKIAVGPLDVARAHDRHELALQRRARAGRRVVIPGRRILGIRQRASGCIVPPRKTTTAANRRCLINAPLPSMHCAKPPAYPRATNLPSESQQACQFSVDSSSIQCRSDDPCHLRALPLDNRRNLCSLWLSTLDPRLSTPPCPCSSSAPSPSITSKRRRPAATACWAARPPTSPTRPASSPRAAGQRRRRRLAGRAHRAPQQPRHRRLRPPGRARRQIVPLDRPLRAEHERPRDARHRSSTCSASSSRCSPKTSAAPSTCSWPTACRPLQLKVLDQVPGCRLAVADTMELWIQTDARRPDEAASRASTAW